MSEGDGSVNSSTKGVVLFIATMSSFLMPFMASAVNITLKSVGEEFSMDAVMLTWINTAYLLVAAMFLLPFGRIADIHGRKRMFSYGTMVFTAGALLCAFSPSALFLIASRVVQGFGASMMFGMSIAILTSVFPPQERGKALGYNVAAVYLGQSAGPFIGGILTDRAGWRSLFILCTVLGIMILAIVALKLKGEWVEAKGERFDPVGAVIYSLTLVSIIYGLSLLPDWEGGMLIALGLSGLVGFTVWESRVEAPLLHLDLFRKNRVFAFSNLAALVNYCTTAGVTFLLSLYLQYIKGFPAEMAGIVLVLQPIVQAQYSPFAGRLSDRVEPRMVASAGMALTVVGLLLLAFIDPGTSLAYVFVSLVLLGFGFALFSSPNTNAIMCSVERRSFGVASATVGTMRLTGQMISMGVVTLLFSLFIGRVEIGPANFDAFVASARLAFAIFAVLCFFGIFASMARGKVHKGSGEEGQR